MWASTVAGWHRHDGESGVHLTGRRRFGGYANGTVTVSAAESVSINVGGQPTGRTVSIDASKSAEAQKWIDDLADKQAAGVKDAEFQRLVEG